MSVLFSAILLQIVTPMPAGTSTVEIPAVKRTRTCRDMFNSSSRLGSYKVCKTKVEWARWDRCHGATRYCAPVKQAFVPEDADLVCKYLKVTGSRVAQEKICASRRQWYVMEQETQEAVRDRQNQSKRPGANQ